METENTDERVLLEHMEGEDEFYLRVPYSLKEKSKRIGGVWTQSRRAWRFPVDLTIWDEIREAFGGQGRLFVAKSFLRRIDEIRRMQERFFQFRELAEEDSPIDFGVDGVSLEGKNPLFNYQRWGVKCGLMAGEGFLIGDVPGLGKTVQSIGIAIDRKNRGEISNCLVVCPASLKYNWLDEIAKFTRERALVVDGDRDERHAKWMASGYFFKIANYECIVGDLFLDPSSERKARKKPMSREEIDFRRYMQSQFDMVVADEIHAIKHHGSQRTQALKQLKAKYRVGLSGTPVDGRLEELHSIFGFLKPGLFESRAVFMERHAVTDRFGKVISYVGIQEVKDRIRPYYIRRLKEKVLKDLPEKLFKNVYVELDKPEMSLYKELVAGASEITSEEMAATRVLRARQFLDFPELLDYRNKSQKFLALAELLHELIDENHEKVLIFTQYKEVLDLIHFNLKSRYGILQIHGGVDAKERVDLVDRFNSDPRWNILLGTDAMSTGLNIGGANSVIHYEDNFSPALMQQRNDRAHRATTRHNVTIYRFICKGTLEENVRKALGGKMDVNNAILDEDCSEFGGTALSNLDLLKFL